MAPERKRAEQAEQRVPVHGASCEQRLSTAQSPSRPSRRVPGPSGPGPFPDFASYFDSHQPHRHAPPSQRRMWMPRAANVSKVRSHRSHTKRPASVLAGGPEWPARNRAEQTEHRVCLPVHSSRREETLFTLTVKEARPRPPMKVMPACSHSSTKRVFYDE